MQPPESSYLSEGFLVNLFEKMTDGVMAYDETGKIILANPALALILGRSLPEIIGENVHAIAREGFQENASSTPGGSYLECDITRPNGQSLRVSIKSFELHGTHPMWVGIFRDQSRLKSARDQLRRTEDQLRYILQSAPIILWYLDSENQVKMSIGAGLQTIKKKPVDLVGKRLDEFVDTTADRILLEKNISQTISQGESRTFIIRISRRYFHSTTAPLRSSSGMIDGVVGVSFDVTDVIGTREALQVTTREYRELFQEAPTGNFVCSPNGRVINCNDEFARIFGFESVDDAIGSSLPNQWRDGDGTLVIQAIAARGRIESPDATALNQMGGVLSISLTATLRKDDEGTPVSIQGAVIDRSEFVRIQQRLKRTETELSTLFHALPDAIFVMNEKGMIRTSNRNIGRSENNPDSNSVKTIYDIIPPEMGRRMSEVITSTIASHEAVSVEYSWSHNDRIEYFEARLFPLGSEEVLIIIRDVTQSILEAKEHEELQTRMLQAQKAESLSVLAGGIAHDFNNLLMGILGNASLALMDIPEDSQLRPLIDQIEKSAVRAADLTKQMLAYAGRGRLSSGPLNLKELVSEMSALLGSVVNAKAKIQINAESKTPLIMGDGTQIRQIVMNLITNASDSFNGKAGDISINIRTVTLEKSEVRQMLLGEELDGGRYVLLSVEDNGCGMTQETVQNIFDPFFTTKDFGRGLGLAAVLGILRGHKAALTVESAPNIGTTFSVYFPELKRASPTPSQIESNTLGQSKLTGKVLLIDDEDSVRDVTARSLMRAGLEVDSQRDGESALKVFRENPSDYIAVILDLLMPKMSGDTVYRELTAINPEIPVLMISGYGEESLREQFPNAKNLGFLSKPFSPSILIRRLKTILK